MLSLDIAKCFHCEMLLCFRMLPTHERPRQSDHIGDICRRLLGENSAGSSWGCFRCNGDILNRRNGEKYVRPIDLLFLWAAPTPFDTRGIGSHTTLLEQPIDSWAYFRCNWNVLNLHNGEKFVCPTNLVAMLLAMKFDKIAQSCCGHGWLLWRRHS